VERVGNRGRWGDADERGALNLLDGTTVRAATETVERGEVIELAQPLSAATPAPPGRGGLIHHMTRDGGDYAAGGKVLGRSRYAEDFIAMSTHLGTHIDALAHVWYDEELYNGHPQSAVRSGGAKRCGVEKLGPLVARGVLLDLAAAAGVETLGAGEVVDAASLERCAARAAVEPARGDVVLLRTGWFAAAGEHYFEGEPGLDLSGAAWLAARDVAAIGADNYAVEALAGASNPDGFPVHELLLRDHGIPLIENLDLERLAGAAAGPFLFVALPLPLAGGTASPLAPVAVI
jgi:kynurenine formamidase